MAEIQNGWQSMTKDGSLNVSFQLYEFTTVLTIITAQDMCWISSTICQVPRKKLKNYNITFARHKLSIIIVMVISFHLWKYVWYFFSTLWQLRLNNLNFALRNNFFGVIDSIFLILIMKERSCHCLMKSYDSHKHFKCFIGDWLFPTVKQHEFINYLLM